MIEIKTTLTGGQYIKSMFQLAPEKFLQATRGWLFSEKKKFIGDEKTDGSFRRSVMNKKRSGRSGTWPKNVAKLFKGYVTGTNNIGTLKLTMGIAMNNPSVFTQAIAGMQDGYSVSSPNFMIQPIWKNLEQKGIFKKQHAAFKEMLAAGELEIINARGRLMIFEKYGRGTLLWRGVKNITVPKKIDFYEKWNNTIPAVTNRGQVAVDNVVKKMAQA